VAAADSNQRWASDITGLRTWDGHKARLAVIIDCADRMILAWRLARRITAEDLGEMVREAIFQRFGWETGRACGIEFLSDNGPEYASQRFRQVLEGLGLVACRTPCRSPESNGIAEAFFGSFKRDYVYQSCLETLPDLEEQVPRWIQDYNEVAPHSALGMRSPAQFYREWSAKNRKTPVQN
jgi:putative transposase